MKVSVNWIKEYLDFDLPAIDELVEKIGAQLGAVESVVDVGARYKGIVVVSVVECSKLENSDGHLKICKIDDGGVVKDVERDEHGYVQVVCGASNVQAGALVAWLPPGSVVPSTYGQEPFVLEVRTLRGVVSNGMLASPKELVIGDSHDGLLILNDPADDDKSKLKPGDDFAKAYKLDDYVIDIENKMFTHRPDLFGQLGVAREIAGILGHQFVSPEMYTALKSSQKTDTNLLEVSNELPELVPHIVTQVFQNVTIAPSPVQLQAYLSRVGIRPINNIVDITNYFMVLTGQPLHAYDYDKVKAQDSGAEHATLVVRYPHDGEKLTLLNGKEIVLRPEAIVIATATKAIGLGGVMGGTETEVDEHTKNIILECATFDMYSIRRMSMSSGLFTDAVTRFNKGQSPLQNDRVIAWAAAEIIHAAGASLIETRNINHLSEAVCARDSLFEPVMIGVQFVNERLGLQLTGEEMTRLLSNVECRVTANDDTTLRVTAPFWRTDIELREDVVEEVGRLYGFDKLPLELPRRDIAPVKKDMLLETRVKVSDILRRSGANEVLTYTFVHGSLLEAAGQDREQAFQLANALSPDLQYYRLSLTPSLLDKVRLNLKAGHNEFALFEINKVHAQRVADKSGLPLESTRVGFLFASDDKAAATHSGAAYYQARVYVDELLVANGSDDITFNPLPKTVMDIDTLTEQMIRPFEPDRSALLLLDGHIVGIVGEYRLAVHKALKLPAFCAGFELSMDCLVDGRSLHYNPLPRFPKVEQDICLKVAADLSYEELKRSVEDALDHHRPENTLCSLTPIDIYQRDDDQEHKQVTLRLAIASYDRTLTDVEVNTLLEQVAATMKDQFRAERV
jgi:phenylalanyl-tRNA synthetase beta chain